MGVIKQGILGGFQNKVGPVIGSSWKGIATMRAMPVSVANPRTALQIQNRDRMGVMARLGSTLLPTIIKPLLDRGAQQMSGYNRFVQANIALVTDVPTIQGDSVWIASGPVSLPANIQCNNLGIGTTYTITWNTALVGDALATDEIYIACIANDLQDYIGFAAVAPRSAGTATVNLQGLNPTGRSWGVLVAFRRADGTKTSNTYGMAKN